MKTNNWEKIGQILHDERQSPPESAWLKVNQRSKNDSRTRLIRWYRPLAAAASIILLIGMVWIVNTKNEKAKMPVFASHEVIIDKNFYQSDQYDFYVVLTKRRRAGQLRY